MSEGGQTSEHFLLAHISQDYSVNFMLIYDCFLSRNDVMTTKAVSVVVEFPKLVRPWQVVLTRDAYLLKFLA